MEICRACLVSGEPLIGFDESFLTNYNSLTNLNIMLHDGLPQYSCQSCANTIQFFKQFREKCKKNESTLRAAIENAKLDDKDSTKSIGKHLNILCDIKQDIEVKSEDCISTEKYYDEFSYDYDDDGYNNLKTEIKEEPDSVEPIKKKGQKQKRKCSKNHTSVRTNRSSKSAVKLRSKERNKTRKYIKQDPSANSETTFLHCGICIKKGFEDENQLKLHLESHKKNSQCELCGEKVLSWPQLFGHRLKHLPKKQTKCHLCGRHYKAPRYLEFHYLNSHNDGQEKSVKCHLCRRSYTTARKLTKHISFAHSENMYVCDHCSKVFNEKAVLAKHMLVHQEEKNIKCDLCEFTCKNATSLKNHKLNRHNPNKIICKRCHRPFSGQETFDVHKCTTRLAMCPICGKMLHPKSLMRTHLDTHKDVGRHKCDRCPAVYKSAQGLKIHMNQHLGIRDKKCEFCPATFFYSSVLIKHRRIHTGEKPYVCEDCGKSFTGRNNLKVHMQMHGQFLIKKKNQIEDVQQSISNV